MYIPRQEHGARLNTNRYCILIDLPHNAATLQIPNVSELTLEPGQETTVSVLACNDYRVTNTRITLYNVSVSETANTNSIRPNGILDYFETRRRGFSVQTWDGLNCVEVRVRLYNNPAFLLTGMRVVVYIIDSDRRHLNPSNKTFNVTFPNKTDTITTDLEDATTEHTTGEDTTTELNTPEDTTTEVNTTTELNTPEDTTTELNTPEDTTTELNTPEDTTTEHITDASPSISASVAASISTGLAGIVIVIQVMVIAALACVIAKSRNKNPPNTHELQVIENVQENEDV